MKEILKLKNEDGSILVVALIILVLLTLIGISVSTTSEIEIRIAGNEMRYKTNLYNAEAVAMEGAQAMEGDPVLDVDANAYLVRTAVDIQDQILGDTIWGNGQVSANGDPYAKYIGVVEGIAEGTSLDMTKSRVHIYTIYGRWANTVNEAEGRSIVRLGYKKAF